MTELCQVTKENATITIGKQLVEMKKPLQKSSIPDNKVFVIRDMREPYFDRHWHAHPEYQLFAILKGSGTRYIGDDIRSFRGGELVLTGPGLPHVWRSDNEYFDLSNGLDTHGIVIYFGDSFLGKNAWEKEEFADVAKLLDKSCLGLEITGKTNKKVIGMMKELVRLKGTRSIIMLMEILATLAESTEINTISQVNYSYKQPEPEKDKMGEILEYILKNYKNKISLKEVASLANMSESAFSRYFKSHVNKSFSDFLGDVRISNARKLLQEGDLNISQVCFESGFPTLSNFNKQFKDRLGKTPLAYKKDYIDTF